ncbi:MAG: hypothetical protein ACHQ15_04860 [Candidatus Limnocylindrales bacterium]
MTDDTAVPGPAGRVRAARLTDLAALGELSRLSHGEGPEDGSVHSLGLPVTGSQISVFSLFRMPLGAFQAQDRLYVYEEDHRIAGLLRAESDGHRDEWTIVELDAVGQGEAGDISYRLVHHLLRDGAKRGVARFHVACADQGGNVELFMQHGFARYGEEWLYARPPDLALPEPFGPEQMAETGIRPTAPLDALGLSRLYAAATPQPVVRLEAYRLPDWERQGAQWRVPRSSLAPILRFADVSAFIQVRAGADVQQADAEFGAFLQVGVAKEDQPHYLRIVARSDHDTAQLIRFGLGHIGDAAAGHRVGVRGHRHDHGVVAPVRTYESPIDRRLEEADFERIATVTLLMKETLVRVAIPALVPAVR